MARSDKHEDEQIQNGGGQSLVNNLDGVPAESFSKDDALKALKGRGRYASHFIRLSFGPDQPFRSVTLSEIGEMVRQEARRWRSYICTAYGVVGLMMPLAMIGKPFSWLFGFLMIFTLTYAAGIYGKINTPVTHHIHKKANKDLRYKMLKKALAKSTRFYGGNWKESVPFFVGFLSLIFTTIILFYLNANADMEAVVKFIREMRNVNLASDI